MKNTSIKRSDLLHKKNRIGQSFIHLFFIVFCFSIILPLILSVVVSFSSEVSVMQYGYSFIPNEWSLDAYRFVFRDNSIFVSYGVTILVTVVGTAVSVLLCSLCAFVISRPHLKYRNIIAFYLYIPTIVGAGLIPWYYTIKEILNLSNTIWVLILPSLISSYNIFLFRNYYKGIPISFFEAAEIDGATPIQMYFKILLPVSLPITATIVLFVTLGYWNDWFLATWFIDMNHSELYPLQYYLFKTWKRMETVTSVGGEIVPIETGYLATMFITMGPILLVYPFVQKYFMKGLTVGGVKG